MPVSGSNRGHEAWEYIRPLSLMQYGGGRHIADLRELTEDRVMQKATGLHNCTTAVLRWKLMQIGAWITEHSNRIRLKIATTLEKFNHYLRMMKRMEAIAALPC